MKNFEIVSKCIEIEGESYISYGIKAADQNGNTISIVSDVSTDEAFVRSVCEKCNRCKLDPIQLGDVVEDCISFV